MTPSQWLREASRAIAPTAVVAQARKGLRTKLPRWVLGVAIVLVVAAAALAYASSRRRVRGHYVTAAAERASLTARVSATGTLSALVTVQVGSQISGRIATLGADFNTRVSKGQMLAQIEPQLLQAALSQARASFQAAAGQLTKARANAKNEGRRLARSHNLSDNRLLAEADLEQAEADSETAKADVVAARGNLEQARAAMRQAEVNLGYATIVSPVDGIVISRSVDVGQTVAASLQAPTLFTIAGDLTKMQVDTSVAEADVGKLKAGMTALFTVDAYPSNEFHGTVREIRNAPQAIQGVVTYDAVVDVDNADLRLKPGMTAHVTFTYAERRDVITVRNAALRFRPSAASDKNPRLSPRRTDGEDPASADQRTLWILKKGVPSPASVRIGISDGAATEVLAGGVRVGDPVIVDGPDADEAPGAEKPPANARLF